MARWGSGATVPAPDGRVGDGHVVGNAGAVERFGGVGERSRVAGEGGGGAVGRGTAA